MTHDKLLNTLDDLAVYNSGYAYIFDALRTVVELHKPTPEGRYPEILCQGCSMTEVNLYVDYPCPTIQAIEKELG